MNPEQNSIDILKRQLKKTKEELAKQTNVNQDLLGENKELKEKINLYLQKVTQNTEEIINLQQKTKQLEEENKIINDKYRENNNLSKKSSNYQFSSFHESDRLQDPTFSTNTAPVQAVFSSTSGPRTPEDDLYPPSTSTQNDNHPIPLSSFDFLSDTDGELSGQKRKNPDEPLDDYDLIYLTESDGENQGTKKVTKKKRAFSEIEDNELIDAIFNITKPLSDTNFSNSYWQRVNETLAKIGIKRQWGSLKGRFSNRLIKKLYKCERLTTDEHKRIAQICYQKYIKDSAANELNKYSNEREKHPERYQAHIKREIDYDDEILEYDETLEYDDT